MRIKNEYRETTVIQKSRFIACVFTVHTEEEARSYISDIRKEFSDASHVCTAFSIGKDLKRSSDNGEPSGTAGIPMLEAIQSQDIEDICACVVRYFGGIKLGTGGLSRAYSNAVLQAIKNAPKVQDEIYQMYSLVYSYDLTGPIEGWLRKNTILDSQEYGEKVHTVVLSKKEITGSIQNLSKGSAQIQFLKEVKKEVDVE